MHRAEIKKVAMRWEWYLSLVAACRCCVAVVVKVAALTGAGIGSAWGTVVTIPLLIGLTGQDAADDVACLYNNMLIPAGEVSAID